MAKECGTIPCSIITFCDSLLILGDDRRNTVQELGFGSMLQMNKIKLRKALLKCLIDDYDPTQERINLGSGQSFGIYPYDIEIIMGFKDTGTIIEIDENITALDVPEVYKTDCTAEGFLLRHLVSVMWSNGPEEEFIRSFVLCVLGTILAPVSDNYVPLSYYSLVQDVSRIKNINWNAFTLSFLKENLANPREGSNKWPNGNLALLQYCYWEKVKPLESSFFFALRTPPLMKYWDEETAFRRDVYEIHNGRAFGTVVVDDLSKAPSIGTLSNVGKEKGIITPNLMGAKNDDAFKESTTKRITSLENFMKSMKEKERNLPTKCLQIDFDDTEDTSESDELNYSDEIQKKEASPMSVAATVKMKKRKKSTPSKYKSVAVSGSASSNKKGKKTQERDGR